MAVMNDFDDNFSAKNLTWYLATVCPISLATGYLLASGLLAAHVPVLFVVFSIGVLGTIVGVVYPKQWAVNRLWEKDFWKNTSTSE